MQSLTDCQLAALNLLENDQNIFLTGVAGSGKSFLLQHFLKNKSLKTHPVVASTGAAAVLVKGVTFHSFFALGIMEGGVDRTVERALKDRRLKKRLERTQTLIIDEISMISGQTLLAAETVARKSRGSEAPWGGMKIIAVGDFGQLPPVQIGGSFRDWAFLSSTWEKSDFQVAYLKTVVRSQDPQFLEVLNFIRNGIVNEVVTNFLNSRLTQKDLQFTGTRLFPHRQSAEDYNLKQLANLPGELRTFQTQYVGQQRFLEQMKKASPVPEVLHLKVGALVMLRKNDPQMAYVNGSLGIIAKILEDSLNIELLNGRNITLDKESFSYMNAEGEVVAGAENFPVNLAWATTIHKSQGMTLDAAAIDLARVFEAGQAYVALSRVKSPEALYLSSWKPQAIRASTEVKNFHDKILKDF